MSLGLPDVKNMTDRSLSCGCVGAVLLYLLLMNPLAISQKLEEVGRCRPRWWQSMGPAADGAGRVCEQG